MKQSLLILSGGLDSAVSAALAGEQSKARLALFFDYGQRAALAEQRSATRVAQWLKVPLKTIGLPWLTELGQSALTQKTRTIPPLSQGELGNHAATTASARAVWVPNRNGVFLNVAAAFTESLGLDQIVTGFNAEEAVTFPDNSGEFVQAADAFFYYSTQNGVKVVSYTQDLDKAGIVHAGLKYDVPFEQLWSCYYNGDKMCGGCESCQRSIRAYRMVGIWERMSPCFQ